jgi:hypothetical protein
LIAPTGWRSFHNIAILWAADCPPNGAAWEAKDHAFHLERLGSAHEYARRELKVEYPFATLDIFEHGGHILHEFDKREPGPTEDDSTSIYGRRDR